MNGMGAREPERIRGVYRHYETSDYYERIWYQPSPGSLYLNRSVEDSVFAALQRHGLSTVLGDLKILEVGCGGGNILSRFVQWGAKENLIYGIDLIENRLKNAQAKIEAGHFQCADARNLPYQDHSFDLILQFTMLSSVLAPNLRHEIAHEMLRVAKPGGIILSFDTRYWNPQNPNTRPLGKNKLNQYFKGCLITCYPVLLIPQLARFVARFSVGFCKFLERIPFLRSHYLAVIRRAGSADLP